MDQSTHTYIYDKLNRLEEVFVSTDKVHQSRQAHYLYYDYGPLARVELGEQKVQGMDYAYTINGWMKAMNGTILNPGYELGRDNASGYLSQNTSVHNKFAKDVVAYTLGYFEGDYQSIGPTNFIPSPYGSGTLSTDISQLYNGNIAFTTSAISDNINSGPQMHIQMGVYRYDQMNRLVSARTFRASGLAASNSWATVAETPEYKSTYSYDKNGNITHLTRNGGGASSLDMDDFEYAFQQVDNTPPLSGSHASNRLDFVNDEASYSGNYSQDIDQQTAGNYGYDNLGQLTSDVSEGMTIEWLSGNRKVKKITRTDKTIEFEYNPFGQRILKKVTLVSTGAITTSYYAYDANGQVMGVYDVNLTSNNASLNELNIYGASRIGMIDREVILCTAGTAAAPPVYPSTIPVIHTLGYKKYEITNYLGNVNAVINDRKIYVGGMYEAVMIMYSDYYPFGMEMPDRNATPNKYRFGYNGMEKDDEVKNSSGSSYTTEFRQYDPRLGRWLSLDPLMQQFPSMSPYVAFDNNPIFYTDPLGLAAEGGGDKSKGNPIKTAISLAMKGAEIAAKKAQKIIDLEEVVVWGTDQSPKSPGRKEKIETKDQKIERKPTTWYTNTNHSITEAPTERMVPGDIVRRKLYDPHGVNYTTGLFGDYQEYEYLGDNTFILTKQFDQVKEGEIITEVALTALPVGRAFKIVGGIIKLSRLARNSKTVANIGTKLEYIFGKATGSVHNIERSTGMLRQLESIGIFDNAAGRALLKDHLEIVYKTSKGVLQENGRYLRESILMGPNGAVKVESIWEGNKLITVKLLGGK